MTASLILVCLWVVLACTAAVVLPRRWHWWAAFALIVAGIPMVGFVTWQHGPLPGGLVMAAGASILRWPVIRLAGWMRRTMVDR